MTDTHTQTHTPHDGIGRAYASYRATTIPDCAEGIKLLKITTILTDTKHRAASL